MASQGERQQLIGRARAYVGDARSAGLTLHGRYGAACSALECLRRAGLVRDEDATEVRRFEERRYDPARLPTAGEVERLLMQVERALPD
jgi:hypothetical protein